MFVVISHRTKEKEQGLNENTQGKRSFKSLSTLKEATNIYIYLEYVPLAKYVLCMFKGNWVKWPWLRQKGQTKCS